MSARPSVLQPPEFLLNRRQTLAGAAGWLGALAGFHALGGPNALRAAERGEPPSATGSTPRRGGKAKAAICLFQHGGPSQMDLFDPKIELTKRHGQKYQGELEVHFHTKQGNLLASPYKFQKCGEVGMELSELLPYTARIADDLTLVRSMTTESVDHESALRLFQGGKFQAGRPSLGSWLQYAFGSENQDLPGYVVLSDPGGLPVDGERNWSSGWLPPQYQGTPFASGKSPILNLETPSDTSSTGRRRQLDLLARLNAVHRARHEHNEELAARGMNFEIAARMQRSIPDVIDLSGETEATRRLYGLDRPDSAEYGTRCLLARRLIERGVRFVTLFLNSQPWDTHDKNAERLKGLCAKTDQPSAALVTDLKQRGLLDETIVIWAGEFGRLPISQDKDGRDHNRHAFSLWLAGGGFRAGYVHGATDDFGYRSVEDVVSIHDLHATILAALGLDHRELTYPHEGREDSLTDAPVTGARVVDKLLA